MQNDNKPPVTEWSTGNNSGIIMNNLNGGEMQTKTNEIHFNHSTHRVDVCGVVFYLVGNLAIHVLQQLLRFCGAICTSHCRNFSNAIGSPG